MTRSRLSHAPQLGRRSFLQLAAASAGTIGASSLLSGCGGDSSSDSSSLNVLTWQTYHDRPWLEEFTKKSGIKVNAVNVGSPAEMFSKVKASPDAFDIALVTSGWFKNYAAEDLLVPIETKRLDALTSMKLGFDWQAATAVEGELLGVLYNWGDQAMAWLDGDLPGGDSLSEFLDENGQPNDWNILWHPAFKNRVSLFDDPTSVIPMIPLALGFDDPFNLDEQQFKAVKDKLMALRPQVPRLTSGYDDQTQQFAAGEASIGYLNLSVTVNDLQKLGKTMRVNNAVKQGVPAWSDNYAITQAGSKKSDAVYEFINHTMQLPWMARFAASSGGAGILDYEQATSEEAKGAGLDEAALALTLIPATQQGDEFFSKMVFFQDVENLQRRLDLWNEFKLGLG